MTSSNGSYLLLTNKIPRSMKLTALSLMLSLSAFATNADAQQVSVTVSNAKVKTVLNSISDQTGLSLAYSAQVVDLNRKVSLNFVNTEVSEVLNAMFGNTAIGYEIKDGKIYLFKAAERTTALANQQKKIITGTVVDPNGEAVIGANVLVKGTTNGTITDMDGKFSLEVPEGAMLLVSYIGYGDYETKVGNQSNLSITLKEDSQALDEVVVVGYGTQKKVNLTGSIGTIKTDETLKARPVTNVQELLAGSVPGMSVSKGSGAAGSGASINIRGTSTIGSSSGVLVLIDGVPGNIYTLNPNDIESISVLKDAASAAIYGSRAANGVMLITTKSSSTSERPVVEVSSNIGIQNPQFKIDFVGTEDYMRLYDQALMNDGKDPYYGEQGIQDFRNGKYVDNQWYKDIYKKNTLINNTHVALSGKERSISYRVSVSNDYQDGTLPNNNYNRLIFKPDLTFNMRSNLKAHASFQYTQTNIQNPQGGTEIWQIQASRISPLTRITEENGLYAVGSSVGGNPIAGVNESGYSKERHKEMMAIFDVSYSPIKDWNIKGSVATYSHSTKTKDRVNTYYLYNENGDIAKTENQVSSLKETESYAYRTQIQFTTDYSFKIKEDHSFKALAGYSQEYYYTDNFWASRSDMPFDGIDVLDTGSSNKQNGGNAQDVAIQSWFGRLNYDYQGKYLLEATLRADGSSRFAKGNRWGVFPSFSAGWNINRETFMESANN